MCITYFFKNYYDDIVETITYGACNLLVFLRKLIRNLLKYEILNFKIIVMLTEVILL